GAAACSRVAASVARSSAVSRAARSQCAVPEPAPAVPVTGRAGAGAVTMTVVSSEWTARQDGGRSGGARLLVPAVRPHGARLDGKEDEGGEVRCPWSSAGRGKPRGNRREVPARTGRILGARTGGADDPAEVDVPASHLSLPRVSHGHHPARRRRAPSTLP